MSNQVIVSSRNSGDVPLLPAGKIPSGVRGGRLPPVVAMVPAGAAGRTAVLLVFLFHSFCCSLMVKVEEFAGSLPAERVHSAISIEGQYR